VFGTITSLRLADYGMKVRVYHNGDDVFIAWRPDGFVLIGPDPRPRLRPHEPQLRVIQLVEWEPV
jgi:hypothetical protein